MGGAKEYRSESIQLKGNDLSVKSYRIENQFFCHVENLDPGAVIARGEGKTREEAVKNALQKAGERLSPR